MLAAREAMANAAEHSGADEVSAFVDVGDDEIAILSGIAAGGSTRTSGRRDSHGIAESIRGRMTRAGGTAPNVSSRDRGRAAAGEADMAAAA